MEPPKDSDLIKGQIEKSYLEMLFQNAIFSLMNSVSLFVIWIVLYNTFVKGQPVSDDYSKTIQSAATIFVPYLTFVAQGFCFPRRRKVQILSHFLRKGNLTDTDMKCIYDK
jgi:hypothetical protein